MSENEYKVHKIWLEEANFEILVLEVPLVELEDKLAYLARDKGNINKSYYEDFVIATCIANINQLLFSIKLQPLGPEDLLNIRNRVMDAIIEINPALSPDKLIINKNLVIKCKQPGKLKDDERLLKDNKNWDVPINIDPMEEVFLDEEDLEGKNNVIKDKLKNIEELEYTVVKKWWPRINKYIEIKKYNEEDLYSLVSRSFFHDRSTFHTYVVTLCVVDSEALFVMLDDMGIPARVAIVILIKEVYDLCKTINPFLTFEKAMECYDPELEDTQPDSTPRKESPGGGPSSKMASYAKRTLRKKHKKNGFKNLKKADLLKLASAMKVSIIGQDKAVDQITEAVKRASVGLKDPDKPIGSFLFAGKTGIGKTMTSKILANELIKDKDNLVTIDCSEYSADHEYAKLIGCFVPGSKVLKADGSVANIEDINVGDKVVSHTGKKRNVNYVHEYDQDGDMVEITMVNSNIPVVTTKTHEIYTIKGTKCQYNNRKNVVCKPTCSKEECTDKLYNKYVPEWIPASKLEEGDIVMYPRIKTSGEYPTKLDLANYLDGINKYKLDDDYIWAQKHVKIPRYIEVGEDLARLAGYYVSEEGCSSSEGSINFTFHSKEHDYIIEVVKLIRKLFGKEVRIKIEDRSKAHSYKIYISSKVICNFMCAMFGRNTYVKKLPIWFNELPDHCIKGFLETAVFGDGCTVIPRRMDYSTVSPNLFYQMEQLFRKLGYITYKQLEPRSKNNSNWSDRYRLYIGGNQLEALNEDFNFNVDLSNMKQTNIQRMAWMDEDYLYLQIKKINNIHYKGKVYDLAVQEDTSYVTEIIVHNSPSGYVGHEQGGMLTNAIMENPFSVVVFDEVEKASSKVHELMLQILEEGRLTDGKGKKVSFKETVVIMTSNIGVDEVEEIKKTIGFGDVAKITEPKKVRAISKAIKKKFKPEFLNRIDAIVHFVDLKKKDYLRIIEIELYKLNQNLRSNNTEYKSLNIKFDNTVRNFVYKKGIDEDYGARPLKRCIETEIATPLANELLNSDPEKDSIVEVTAKKGKAVFTIQEKKKDTKHLLSKETAI